jgi:hypothetical protein
MMARPIAVNSRYIRSHCLTGTSVAQPVTESAATTAWLFCLISRPLSPVLPVQYVECDVGDHVFLAANHTSAT